MSRGRPAARWDGQPGDVYRYELGRGLTVGGVPAARLPATASAPAARATVPPDVVIVPDPRNEDERALLGAALRGTVTLAAIADLLREPSHRQIAGVLAGFDFSSGVSLTALVTACRAAGLPPELTGRVTAGGCVGYLAACAAMAPHEAGAVEILGRLRRK